MKFAKLVINTATLVGSIYQNAIKDTIDLKKIVKRIKRDDVIINARYFENSKKRRDKKDFSHSCTLKISKNHHIINVKISTNGAIHTTGIKSAQERVFVIELLQQLLSSFAQADSTIFRYPISITLDNSPMVTASTAIISPKDMQIDNDKLVNLLRLAGIFCIYRKKGANVEFYIDNITYSIYPSCKIKITYSNITTDENVLFSHIDNLIGKSIEELQMVDKIDVCVSDIEKTSAIKQGSQEWLKTRLGKITATRICLACGEKAFGRDKESLIEVLSNEMNGIPEPFFSNKYCRKGTRYEPIARKVILFHKSYWTSGAKFAIFESGMILHKKCDYIGASPDGFMFIFDDKIQSVPTNVAELRKAHKDKLINDVFLVEIKCPWKVKDAYCECNETVKCLDGYVPKNYWMQMQQQMAVTGVNITLFVSNNIQEYANEDEFIKHIDEPNYKGIAIHYLTYEKNGNICKNDCPGCSICTRIKEVTIYSGDMDNAASFSNNICINTKHMAVIKGILDKKYTESAPKSRVFDKKYVYWYMATLPEMTTVLADSSWYESTALPNAKKVYEEATKISKLSRDNIKH